jgi:predicted Zn-dependent protease
MRLRKTAAALAAAASLGPGVLQPAAAATLDLRLPGAKPQLASEEGGVWAEFDKAEAYAKTSAELNADPALNAYVREVICKIASEYCGELRIYVMERPVFNASAAANGYIEVNSGLLLRARDEDELASVLGHEVSHFARNHSLQRLRDVKMTANAMLLLSMGVAAGSAAASYSAAANSSSPAAAQAQINNISAAARGVSNLIYLAGVASLYAYNREQESEADRLGFERAATAGYAPRASVDLWQDLVAEHSASDFPKVRSSDVSGSIFNSHPITTDRIAALTTMSASGKAADADAQRRYRAKIRAHLSDWLKDDLRRRDYGQTLHLIGQLETEGEDLGVLEFYRGEAYRLRRDAADPPQALAAYKAAVSHDDAPAAAWRELGDAQARTGDTDGAVMSYHAYLDHAPQAQDRWLVEASLKKLEQPKG